MSDSRERTDRLLDEIDELVDASLSRGDQSGSWQGERYDRCPKCSEAWHFLPITRTMYEMRLGSYATDEFNQGIVDPNYKYQEDTSPILCPGSEWLGPPIGNREWGWYLRKSGRRPAPRPSRQSTSRRPSGVGRSRGFSYPRWRFIGPFEHWDVELNHEVQFANTTRGRLVRPEPIGAITTATFRYTAPIPIPDHRWWLINGDSILRDYWGQDEHGIHRHLAVMKPITFEYYELVAYGDNPSRTPDYVIFETNFPVNRHEWWMEFWQREPDLSFNVEQARLAVLEVAEGESAPTQNLRYVDGLGYVTIDEAYEMPTEHIRAAMEDIPSFSEAMRDTIIEMSNAAGLPPEQIERLIADEAHSTGQGSTTEEEGGQPQR